MLSIVVFDVKKFARFDCVRHLALMQTTPLFPTLQKAKTITIVSIYQNNTKKYIIHNVDRLVTLFPSFTEQDRVCIARVKYNVALTRWYIVRLALITSTGKTL